jgi:nicotinate-nucleotide adenylyltransferase
MGQMLRIGLFGGSFDPVHCAHLLVAQAALEELNLGRVVFVPAAQSPFKPEQVPAPAADRLRWLHLALTGEPKFEVDDQEVRRGPPSFTIDTVRNYRERFPNAELCYIIGADHVPLLPKWRAADELAGAVEFVAIPRPGDPPVEPPQPFRVRQLTGFPFAISSRQIRARVRNGLPIEGLVPRAVAEDLLKSGLYL